eukprot:RCo018472
MGSYPSFNACCEERVWQQKAARLREVIVIWFPSRKSFGVFVCACGPSPSIFCEACNTEGGFRSLTRAMPASRKVLRNSGAVRLTKRTSSCKAARFRLAFQLW